MDDTNTKVTCNPLLGLKYHSPRGLTNQDKSWNDQEGKGDSEVVLMSKQTQNAGQQGIN